MPLIEPIRIVLLPVLSYLCPLLIIGCFLVSFGHWVNAKGYTALTIYSLSIFTHALIKALAVSAEQAALIGGIIAPALYGLFFVGLGAVRSLRIPYGRSILPVQPKRQGRAQQLITSTLGGCVGSVTGSSLGAVVGLVLFIVAPVLALDANLSWQTHQIPWILAWSVGLFGTVGLLLGVLVGWGAVNLKQLGDWVLIYITIQGFLAFSAGRRLLRRIWRR